MTSADINVPLLNNQIKNMQENFNEHKISTEKRFDKGEKQNEEILRTVRDGFKSLESVYTTKVEHTEIITRITKIEEVKDIVTKWLIYVALV